VFTSEQHLAKAAEYSQLAKQANASGEGGKERSFTILADNEHWLANNQHKLANNLEEGVDVLMRNRASEPPAVGEQALVKNDAKRTSETTHPEGLQVIEYNEQEEIVTIELHRHLLQHPGEREAIIKHFVEIIEHGPHPSI
jgi:rubrerythrin